MSNDLMTLIRTRKVGSHLKKSVLLAMADRANDDGSGVWTSKQRIADELEASRQGVVNAIKAMIEDNLLIEIGRRKCTNGYTMEYHISVSAVMELPFRKRYVVNPPKSVGVEDTPTNMDVTPPPGVGDPPTQFTQTLQNPPEPATCAARELPENLLERCLEAMGADMHSVAGSAGLLNLSPIISLIRPAKGDPADFELDVLPNIMAARGRQIRNWRYFREAIIESRDLRLQGNPDPVIRTAKRANGSGSARQPAERTDFATAKRLHAEVRESGERQATERGAEPFRGSELAECWGDALTADGPSQRRGHLAVAYDHDAAVCEEGR